MSHPVTDPSAAELAATVQRWRDRRNWTIQQWKDESPDENWPRYNATVQIEHDAAVDALVARCEQLERERDEWKAATIRLERQRLAERHGGD